MKKLLLITCLLFVLTGCGEKNHESILIEVNKSDYLKLDSFTNNELDTSEYDLKLSEIAKRNSVLGMQVVVFKDGEVIDTYSWGYDDLSKKVEVNDDTVFRIASTSKTISNMAIMKLVEEDKINLTDSISKVTGLSFDSDVELRHILSHTSGYGDSGLYDGNLESYVDIDKLISAGDRERKAGSSFEYSNFVAGTMAAIIERVTGEYFLDYTSEVLFKPLDMNASYVAEGLKEGTRVAKMHFFGLPQEEYDPSTWEYDEAFYRSFGLGNQYRLAHGNLLTSAKDLAKLGIVLAGDGSYQDIRILKETTLDLIRYKRFNASSVYGMGLNTDIYDNNMVNGRLLYGHTGQAYDAISALLYDPNDQSGVVIITNHCLNNKTNGITNLIHDITNCAYNYLID